MRLRFLFLLGLAVSAPLWSFAQEIDEDLVSPVPPPRPEQFGTPDSESSDEDASDQGLLPNNGPGPDQRPDFSDITDQQPVTLSARLTDAGPFIPEGLVWRIFDTEVDNSGELALLAKSEEATASFNLPPGEYVMHVAYGQAQASDTMFVEPGPNTHTIVFEVGGLELNAMVTGDVPIPNNLLHFDVYSEGPDGRTTVAEDLAPGEMIYLNAGVYSIVSRFGPVNATVRSEIRVEPGQITEATLYHEAAQVALRLVSEEGGEAIADVEWTVKTSDGDTIFTDIGAFPATVLAEGEYLALAKLGDNVYNREFSVAPGAPRDIEILTSVYQQ